MGDVIIPKLVSSRKIYVLVKIDTDLNMILANKGYTAT